MADVSGKFFSATKVRTGVSPSSPGVIEGETLPPLNPPGSSLNEYVPYEGATQNVDLGEFGVEAGFVNLDTTPTNTPTTQGTIYWDDARSTAALIMNGTIQHIGQDTFFYVKNSTGFSIPKGTAVRFAGTDGASGHLLITPFLANGSVPSTYFMGVTAEEIANGAFGQVMHFGELEGINTSGFTAGSLLYASTTVAGGFQTTAPVAPNNIVLIAATINSKNNGAILVRPTYGSNINTDEGVKITSPATGQLLQLQAGGLWENKTLAQVLGGTSSQFVKGDGSVDSTSYQPLLTNPVTGTGVSGQVSFWNGTTSQTGDNGLFWNNTNKRLGIGTNVPLSKAQVVFTADFDGLRIQNLGRGHNYLLTTSGVTAQSFAIYDIDNSSNLYVAGVQAHRFFTGTPSVERWQITSTGILQSNGAQTIQTSTGNLTLATGGGNGNIVLSPNGTGDVGIGVTNMSSFFNQASNLVIGNTGNVGLTIYSSTSDNNVIAFADVADGLNSGFNAGGCIIYNHPSNSLIIRVNGAERLRIFSNGNVGINTGDTNAGFRLDVNGTARVSGNLTVNTGNIELLAGGVGSSFNRQISLGSGTAYNYQVRANGDDFQLIEAGSHVFLQYIYGGSLGNGRIVLNNRVGIGENSPNERLVVRQTTNDISSAGFYTSASTGLSYGPIILAGTNSSDASLRVLNQAGTVSYLHVRGDGNVGIGTTSPEALSNNTTLQIDGTNHSFVRTGTSNYGGYFATIPTADVLVISNVRNPVTGTYSNTGKAASTIGLFSASSNGYIEFSTTATNNSGPSPRMTITSGGNVLIGTTTDNGQKLQVSGTVAATVGTTSAFGFVVDVNSTFAFGATNGRRTGAIKANFGDQPGLQFGYDATDNTGIIAGATESLGAGLDFYTYNGSSWGNRIRVTSTGDVGIGVNNPTGVLTINPPTLNNKSSIEFTNSDNAAISSHFNLVFAVDNTNTVGGRNISFSKGGKGYGNQVSQMMLIDADSGNVGIGESSPNSRLQVNGSLALPHTTKSANYTLTATDYTVGFDCASNRTATLPDATTCAGRIYVIYQYNTNIGLRYVTLDGNGSQTINGLTTLNLQYQDEFSSVMIQSTGSNWVVISYALYAAPV